MVEREQSGPPPFVGAPIWQTPAWYSNRGHCAQPGHSSRSARRLFSMGPADITLWGQKRPFTARGEEKGGRWGGGKHLNNLNGALHNYTPNSLVYSLSLVKRSEFLFFYVINKEKKLHNTLLLRDYSEKPMSVEFVWIW